MTRTVRRVVLFVAGLLSIVTGLVLVVLPGPLTIPPILFGLWLWSLEFEIAQRWMHRIRERGGDTLGQAREAPVRTTVVSVLGLAGAAALVWATLRYDLLDRGRELVGLG